MVETSVRTSSSDGSEPTTAIATTEWSRDSEATPVVAVVSAVADADDADPLELPPLDAAIDPEALNDLFTSRARPAVDRVSFQYLGYEVVVHGDGTVGVHAASDA